jgi:hypothetical protein
MNAALQLFLFLVLGAFFLYEGLSKRHRMYWGRRGNVEFTPVQQKLLGHIWGAGFLVLAFVSAWRLLSPVAVKQTAWDHLLVATLFTAACSTWAAALLDRRFRKTKTRLGLFILLVNGIGAAIVGFIAVWNLAELF